MALDPATGDWRTLPAGPLPSGMGPAATWDGDEVVVVAAGAVSAGTAPPPTPVAGLDPATNAWRQLPSAPTELQGMTPTVAWTGTVLLLTGGINGDRRNEVVLAFDPTASSGPRSADGRSQPHGVRAGVWPVAASPRSAANGSAAIRPLTSVAFDPAAGSRLCAEPARSQPAQRRAVWTGSELLGLGRAAPTPRAIGDTALATESRAPDAARPDFDRSGHRTATSGARAELGRRRPPEPGQAVGGLVGQVVVEDRRQGEEPARRHEDAVVEGGQVRTR